jgi:hypothetical protein
MSPTIREALKWLDVQKKNEFSMRDYAQYYEKIHHKEMPTFQKQVLHSYFDKLTSRLSYERNNFGKLCVTFLSLPENKRLNLGN